MADDTNWNSDTLKNIAQARLGKSSPSKPEPKPKKPINYSNAAKNTSAIIARKGSTKNPWAPTPLTKAEKTPIVKAKVSSKGGITKTIKSTTFPGNQRVVDTQYSKDYPGGRKNTWGSKKGYYEGAVNDASSKYNFKTVNKKKPV